jgi:RNA polymerase sigma-70 factor, ECF subfamily
MKEDNGAASARPLTDPASFDPHQLVQTHQAGVRRYLRAMGCQAALADDVTQETFVAVLTRPFQDIHPAATFAYLRKTAQHILIAHVRRAGRFQSLDNIERLDELWTREAGHDNAEMVLLHLRECLAGLSNRARLALDMRFRGKHSRAEIAAVLGITEHGAKNLLQRAKHALRSCLDKKLERNGMPAVKHSAS